MKRRYWRLPEPRNGLDEALGDLQQWWWQARAASTAGAVLGVGELGRLRILIARLEAEAKKALREAREDEAFALQREQEIGRLLAAGALKLDDLA